MSENLVVVELQVDPNDPNAKMSEEDMQEAAIQAVRNAVQFAYENGFSHEFADVCSIGLVDVRGFSPAQ